MSTPGERAMAELTFQSENQGAAQIHIDVTERFPIDELRASIASVRAQAGQIDLPPVLRDLVDGALDSAVEEAAKDEPDRVRLAGFLWTATGMVKKASSFVAGCAPVLDSLQRVANLLGLHGHTALTVAAL